MVQVGKLVGVKQIVGGSISKVGNLFTVQLRMIGSCCKPIEMKNFIFFNYF
jgi:hypothetical protein